MNFDSVMVIIIKDVGDDFDVIYGVFVFLMVCLFFLGSGVRFKVGLGVGMVIRFGLLIFLGELVINLVFWDMMWIVIFEVGVVFGGMGDVEIEIGIFGGEELVFKILNLWFGIVGGLLVFGIIGIVWLFFCVVWIVLIYCGIDVVCVIGLVYVVGVIGVMLECVVEIWYELDKVVYFDMGDFVGGFLKYLCSYLVFKIIMVGGFVKFIKFV